MYPDTLNLHGERGNILALRRYGEKLGLNVKVDRIDLGTRNFDPMNYDILFFAAGEISSFEAVIDHIGTYTTSLAVYIASGKILLATGTTAAMFGDKIERISPLSKSIPVSKPDLKDPDPVYGLSIIPVKAKERELVYGNDLYIQAEFDGMSMELIGNQITMADLEFKESHGFRRFGTVVYGRGNNGEDSIEGVVHNNAVFTNMIGPMLVGNPWLAVQMLKAAAKLKGGEITAPDPDYSIELKSFPLKKEFISQKMKQKAKK